jgi:peptidyl-prolyl cis-trans isomerase A (cyclophilin A)
MKTRLARFAVAVVLPLLTVMCAEKSAAAIRTAPAIPAPDTFTVVFATTRGPFTVQVYRAWAPNGADRFYQLVGSGFFDGQRFFRVVPGFVAQWGLHGEPKTNEPWDVKPLDDDSVKASNVRGTVTFANLGPHTRTHQLFINLADNKNLDALGFAPIGRVVDGMAVVDSLFSAYGEKPDQALIQTLGNSYLDRVFPKLDGIDSARVVP